MSDDTRLVDPDVAIDYLIANAGRHAQAKANRVYLNEFRKSKKALLMNACTDKQVAAKEAYAYSHPDYIALLEGLREAVVVEETLHWKQRAAELRVEVWRSKNANNRNMDRTMR